MHERSARLRKSFVKVRIARCLTAKIKVREAVKLCVRSEVCGSHSGSKRVRVRKECALCNADPDFVGRVGTLSSSTVGAAPMLLLLLLYRTNVGQRRRAGR